MTSVLSRPTIDRLSADRLTAERPATVRVAIYGVNPVSRATIAARLERRPGIRVVADADPSATVVLAVVAGVDEMLVGRLRSLHRATGRHVVVVADRLDQAGLTALVRAGVTAALPRGEATVERIASAIAEAADRPRPMMTSALPRSLQSAAMRPRPTGSHIVSTVPNGPRRPLSVPLDSDEAAADAAGTSAMDGAAVDSTPVIPSPLSSRERDVLRLVADGWSTREVATQMCYSERTIKNILQDVTVRLDLRNRTHAVATALRNGWL